jgi:N-acetylglutamate synthase-like GNAT family acetyltransferase
MQINIASDRDIVSVVSLLNRAYRATGGETGWTTEVGLLVGDRISEATLREEIAKKPQAFSLVYKSQEEVLGCVWVEPDTDGDTWYLGSLAIDPKQQNSQLGRRLLGAAEDWIRERGGQRIKMTVIDERKTLLDWYERRGYIRTGQTEPFPSTDTRFGTPIVPNLRFEVLIKAL